MRTGWIAVLILACGAGGAASAASPNLAFTKGDKPGEYRFDTGVVRGTVPLNKRSLGLLPAVHTPTGTRLAASMGLFNYYRVFKTSHRFVESMRAIRSKARLLPDGALEMHWPPAENRPFDLTAVYRWTAENILDLETTVVAKAELPDFEVFLASYFTERLPISHAYVQKTPDGRENAFMAADEEAGVWQAFPRDAAATAIIQDGRWTKPPAPVDWAIRPDLAAPIVYRRAPDTKVTVAAMAPPDDAFAVFTPCEGEKHYSMYFGLFGRTLAEGETAKAHSRLVVLSDGGDAAVLDAYNAYMKSLSAQR